MCAANLITDNIEHFHTFTLFKEYKKTKTSLIYVTKDVIQVLHKIFDVIYYLLPKYGYVDNIISKLKNLFKNHVSLQDWYTCKEHVNEIENELISFSVIFIVRKYFEDLYRSQNTHK